jgi:DNA-directed RNA polymerase subunit RPC12/RpoP
MIERVCKQCGKVFLCYPSDVGNYCSRDCHNKSQIKAIVKECEYCGKSFITIPYEVNKGCGRFCSQDCYHKYNCGDSSHRYQNIYLICMNCGKKFKTNQFKLNNGRKYCSKKCQLKHMKGVNHHSYIHGESIQKYCYKFDGVNGVRKRSLAFFNYKCIECGKTNDQNKLQTGKSLSVHHIYYRKMSCCENELEYESGVRKVGNKLYIKEVDDSINDHEIIGKPEKFAVLCTHCHTKTTSFNRYFWIQYYEDKINKLYNGKSFLTKEEYDLFLKNK